MTRTARLYRLPAGRDPEPAGDALPPLATMQAFVGGYVQHLRVDSAGDEMHLFVNDDGRRLALPPNLVASALHAATFGPGTLIAARLGGPDALAALHILGNAWLWHGPLPKT